MESGNKKISKHAWVKKNLQKLETWLQLLVLVFF